MILPDEDIKSRPNFSVLIWRASGLFFLSLLWLKDHGNEMGVVLLLFLSIMSLARWRFNLPAWVTLIDIAACFCTIPFWSNASYGLAIPLFELALDGKALLGLPVLFIIAYFSKLSIAVAVVYTQAIYAGIVLRGWGLETKLYQQEVDRQRRDWYELESLKRELLLANAHVARNAELLERNRIAQDLHDQVGHEITASVLAFQAFEQLWKEEDPQAYEMFKQAQQRLSNSVLQLRETVHNMKPIVNMGVELLQDICKGFSLCPINFQIYGDTLRVPSHFWSILEPCLKEALTNVARHSKAKKVDVKLDINPNIVRLSVLNDGINDNHVNVGIGIRNLRLRARAIGGNISIDTKDGFSLICVLPI